MSVDESKFSGCKKVKNEDGDHIADVCVHPSKDMDKNDMLMVPVDSNAKSMRSITELVNNLKKEKVPHGEILDALEFTGERLRSLKEEETKTSAKAGPFGGSKKSRKSVK